MSKNQSSFSLPSLPGYAKKRANQPKIVKAFQIVNGVRIEKTTEAVSELRDGIPHSLKAKHAGISTLNDAVEIPEKDPLNSQFYGTFRQRRDREKYDDPNSGVSKPLPYADGVPLKTPFLTEDVVFQFSSFFIEQVSESPDETVRVRRADIYFYSQDGTIHIEEPRIENSGLPQGQFLRRETIVKPNGENYTLRDLRIGNVLSATGREFVIVDVDGPSRTKLVALGYDAQPDALPVPTGEYDAAMERSKGTRGGDPTQNYGKQLTSMKYFMEAALGQNVKTKGDPTTEGNKILRFFLAWDDRKSLYGTLSTFSLHYYVYDKTIEIVEDKQANSGKEPFPKLLGRKRMPKRHEGEIYNDADRGVEEGNPKGYYYEEEDFKIGLHVNIWGRTMQIIGCDNFTKQYYMATYGMPESDFECIEVKEPPAPTFPRIPPPHTFGIGSEEDSLASWRHLHPRKPQKDLKKLQKFDGKELHFQAIPLNGPSVKQGRTFSLKYYLMDDCVGVYDVPVKNSGVTPGCFLRRAKFKNPVTGAYFEPSDFYVGAEVEIASNKFKLTYADEYTRSYKAGIPEPPGSQDAEALTETMKFKLWQKNKSMGFLREAFRHVDENHDSKITVGELKRYLQDSCCRGEKLNEEIADEIFKCIDANDDHLLDFNEFCAALAEGSRLNFADLQITTADVSVEDVRPYLATLCRAQQSDAKLFDKLVKRQIHGNTNEMTATVLRDSLLAIRYVSFTVLFEL